MPLYPPNSDYGSSTVTDERSKYLLSMMEDFYTQSITTNQSYWQEADTDTRYYSGDQTLWSNIYGNLPTTYNKQWNFNLIRRIVNMISGYQRRNRKSTIVSPVENGDQETADQLSKVLSWIAQQEGVLETISTSFEHGALITGLNLLHVWVDYRRDPVSGDIKVDNYDYNQLIIDPFFKKADLSDCNAIWTRSYVTKRAAQSLLPGYTKELDEIKPMEGRDGKFQFMPENYNMNSKQLWSYDTFYYRSFRTQKILVDTVSGETLEWKSPNEARLREYLQQFPTIITIDQEIPTVRTAVIVNGQVMYDGKNPESLDCYPFVPMFGYWNPEVSYFPWRCQGVVRGLRDSQYLFNRTKIIQHDILESQANSGWILKENSVINPKDTLLTGQGRNIWVKKDANLQTDLVKIQSAVIDQSVFKLTEDLGKLIMDISGGNEELMGSAVDNKVGILEMLRQGAGLTILQGLFDQLDYSQKLLGKLMIELIQTHFMPGKIARIIEADPTPQFYNRAFGKYDAVVEDGLNTSTQRQMQFAQLLQLREAGVNIPEDVLLEASTIQNKTKIIESLQRQAQQAQQQQQLQMQTEMQSQQAIEMSLRSKAMADQALSAERMAKATDNEAMAETRKHEAIKDDEIGLFNLVRALKEIQGLDLSHMESLLNMSTALKEREAAKEQEAAGKTVEAPATAQPKQTSLGEKKVAKKPVKTKKLVSG